MTPIPSSSVTGTNNWQFWIVLFHGFRSVTVKSSRFIIGEA
jgi:hypothetical protein